MITEEELKTLIFAKYPRENASCEWKGYSNLTHCVSGGEGEDIISYVSGIANMEGGHLLIGLEDGTGEILGIKEFHNLTSENLPPRLIGNCTNLSSEGLSVDEITTSDTKKTIWIINIPKHLPRKPVIAHKKAWQRSGESLIELTKEREDVILSEQIHQIEDWSADICEGATVEDLDEEAIKKAHENFITKFPHLKEEASGWDDITFLNKAKVTINGQITNTAILLLGKPESEHYILPAQAKISWILKDKEGTELDYEHFGVPFLSNVEKVFNKIRNLKYRYIKEETIFPEEVDKYEPFVIREALHNCIAHQDYTHGGRISVMEMPDQLVFTNLGPFLPGSVEKVIEQDAPDERTKNPFLANAMFNLNMIDIIGSGIKRMFHHQKARFFPLPEYDLSNQRVKLTIFGKVLDIEYAHLLARNPDLQLMEIFLLDKVQKRKKLKSGEIKLLKERKLIEGRQPNFHFSAKVAEKTGQMADYIKSRAIKDEHYKRLVLEYLDKYGCVDRRDVDKLLLDILPNILNENQKRNKIKNLLYSMSKRDKSIVNLGTNRKPQWRRTNRQT